MSFWFLFSDSIQTLISLSDPKLRNIKIAAMSNSILLLAILTLALTSFVNSMRFDLQMGSTKCISEDIKINAMTVGKYSVVNPNEGYPLPDSHKITVKVKNIYFLIQLPNLSFDLCGIWVNLLFFIFFEYELPLRNWKMQYLMYWIGGYMRIPLKKLIFFIQMG